MNDIVKFRIYLWSSCIAMANREREEDGTEKFWISRERKELFRWNKKQFL